MRMVFCFLYVALSASAHLPYEQIPDIAHPTLEDFYTIQEYLTHGERKELKKLKDKEHVHRNLQIVAPGKIPESGVIPVNIPLEDKENCLVLYASFNLHYEEGLKRLIELIKESDFKGHILYHLGGWPDLEGGSLVVAHVPHAFKACCLKEAERRGYKHILWLDSSIIPLVSLNAIFREIEEKGYFSIWNYHNVGLYCNPETAGYFGYSLEETYHLLSCQSGFIGIDLTRAEGRAIVDAFYNATFDPNAFFSARSDQTVLSLILHRYHLLQLADLVKAIPLKRYARPDTWFIVDRPFVQCKQLSPKGESFIVR